MKQIKGVVFDVEEESILIDFLREKLPQKSRTAIKDVLAHDVFVDDRRISQFDFQLKKGMRVNIVKGDYKQRIKPRDLDIIYEDKDLFVVNKHEGLLSYSKRVGDVTVISELNSYLEKEHRRVHAHVVHRLDRDTSGLMIVAKSKEVARKLEEDWKGSVYDRAYVAVVWGNVVPHKGTITSWFTDGEFGILSSPTDNGGKKAVTNYEVKKRNGRFSLLELRLDTGRRNQIRVHMRDKGNPVVKDGLYGYRDDSAPISRMALHAYRLCFVHPTTGKKMQFETEVPFEFRKLID